MQFFTKSQAGECLKTTIGSVFLAIMLLATVSATAQENPTVLFSAGAYGTSARVGSIVKVAQTAPVGVGSGCGTAQVPLTRTGTIASVDVEPLVKTGLADTSASDTAQGSTGSADLFQIYLLRGLITASEIKAVSSTTIDSSKNLHSSAAGSKLVNLVVLGTRYSSVPAPNTTIQMAGIGRVVLNEQIVSTTSYQARLTVNMLHLYVTVQNLFGFPVGAEVILSDATSGITKVQGPAAVDGFAFGTEINGKLIHSSPTAPVSVGCRGTNGTTITNTLVGVNLAGLLSSGTIKDTGEGLVSSSNVNSSTSSTIQAVNLLSGLVKASVIHAQASASTPNGVNFTFSNAGSFVGLSVAGHPEINASVAPNTHINIANLGTLYFHRVIQNSNSVTVIMIELVVNQANTLGLPLGEDIKVGFAEASLHSITHP